MSWQELQDDFCHYRKQNNVAIFNAKYFFHEQWFLLYSQVIHSSLAEKCLPFKCFFSQINYTCTIQPHSFFTENIFTVLVITIQRSCVGPGHGKRPREWWVCLSSLYVCGCGGGGVHVCGSDPFLSISVFLYVVELYPVTEALAIWSSSNWSPTLLCCIWPRTLLYTYINKNTH